MCGSLRVLRDGARIDERLPGRQGRALFAYLVLNRARSCPRAELLEVLWPERAPVAAESGLSALLSKLRRVLGADVLSGRRELRLQLEEPVAIDVELAEQALAEAVGALAADDLRAAEELARAAADRVSEPLLPGIDGDWVWERRRAMDVVRVRALECQAEAALRAGGSELGRAEEAARSAIAAAPFRESAYRLLMEVHEAAGNPAEALRVYDELRQVLRDELGTLPGRAVQAVHERVLTGQGEPPAWRQDAPGHGERAPLGPPRGVPAPWPPALAGARESRRFVGRDEELERLQEEWSDALGGARRIVLVAGEAGIGKTTLVGQLAAHAHAAGAAVLYGRCDEDASAPYEPLVEMVRAYAADLPVPAIRARLGPLAEELAVLLPELGHEAAPADRPNALRTHLDAQRLRFFDAVLALVIELGAERPLLLLFDDLHWADRPTLRLVRHLVRAPVPRRVLFVGTYRDEVADEHPIHELAGDLRRDGTLRRLMLGGLEENAVADLVAALGGGAPSAAFLRALRDETEGNPFFIEEVVRHLRDTGAALDDGLRLSDAGVPEGVREVTARRLRRLDVDARQALQAAAVIGREFSFDALEAVCPVQADDLVAALERATAARVVREVSGRVGRYAFRHALIRATLYDSVSALRRVRLHGKVGEALVRLHAGALEEHLGAVAHHFARSAAFEQPERAVEYSVRAARRADRLLAWEDAAVHYREALRARELCGLRGDATHCGLLLALGASQERSGQDEARETFATAAQIARDLGDHELLARSALGFAGQWNVLGGVREDVVACLEEALERLGDGNPALRARLLARLSFELYYSGDAVRRLELSEEAVRLARGTGDLRTLAACLDARHYALWRPETVDERLAVAAELTAVARRVDDRELRLEGIGWTIVDLLELGDVQAADQHIEVASALAREAHQPLYLWWTSLFRTMRAQLAGNFERAERLARETLEIGRRGNAENAVHYFAQQMFNIRREQGRLEEVEGAVREFVSLYPAIPAWRCVLALTHLELGRPEAARATVESLGVPEDLPRDANWLIATTVLAEVVAGLGDVERARRLYPLLVPYARRNVIVGRAASCNGSASRLLGMLAAVMGDWDAAEAHFEEAALMHEWMGARPWAARNQVACAGMLLARGRPGDAEQARALLADAILVADELGMGALGRRARALIREGPERLGEPVAAGGPS